MTSGGFTFAWKRKAAMIPDAEIENRFTYHKPIGNQPQRYEALRAKAKELAFLMRDFCPEGREQSLALTELQRAVMTANLAIAVGEDINTCYRWHGEAVPCPEGSPEDALAAMASCLELEPKLSPDQCCARDHDHDGDCDRHALAHRLRVGMTFTGRWVDVVQLRQKVVPLAVEALDPDKNLITFRLGCGPLMAKEVTFAVWNQIVHAGCITKGCQDWGLAGK